MALKGMDVQGGLAASSKITESAGQIDEQTTNITSQLNSFQWIGTDSDRTQDQWQGLAKQLAQATDTLREFAEVIKKEAEAQEQVSA